MPNPKETALTLRKFVAPEFVYGAQARHLAGRYAKNMGIQRVLLVSDEGVIAAGWTSDIEEALAEAGLEYILFKEITPNPKDHEVMAGTEIYQRESCNGIVVIGGGSPIDCAKGIGIVSTNGGHILDYEGVDMIPKPCPPMVCIPTTAGSGADISQFAIVLDSKTSNKITIISKAIVPDVSLVDPETTTTMNRELTATTGLDTFTHAIEAYVSNASSPFTDLHALESIRLTALYLRMATEEPHNMTARNGMMQASLQASLAFSNASVGLVHAMAHALGGLKGLAHGICNAYLLPFVAEYNFDAVPERYERLGEILADYGGVGDVEPVEAIRIFVYELLQIAGMSGKLNELGVQKDDFPGLGTNAMRDVCAVTNPKRPTIEDVRSIYEKAF